MRFLNFTAAALLVLSSAAFAEEDALKPHPSIPVFPGYHVEDGTTSDFGTHEFVSGRNDDGDVLTTVEGHYWRFSIVKNEKGKLASPVEIERNYKNAIEKKGGKELFRDVDMGGGVATMRMPNGAKGETWVMLQINNSGEGFEMFIVEKGEMKQKVELSAGEMAEALAGEGRVALYGILFDTGKDVIKPESEPLLDEVKKLLDGDKALRIVVGGHTDNVGEKKANQALSQKRAAAVKAWLVKHGVDGKRLEDKGYGDSVPIADNRSEAGRAKNRRVELEKKE